LDKKIYFLQKPNTILLIKKKFIFSKKNSDKLHSTVKQNNKNSFIFCYTKVLILSHNIIPMEKNFLGDFLPNTILNSDGFGVPDISCYRVIFNHPTVESEEPNIQIERGSTINECTVYFYNDNFGGKREYILN
jgi:hypothetical protein